MNILHDTHTTFDGLAFQQNAGRMVLLAESGSRSYGTHREDSDHDFRGVFVATPRQMLSLEGAPQTLRLPEDGEVDGVAWELRHFCKLAAAANPTVLEVLYASQVLASPMGWLLRDNRHLFLSKRIVKTYGGYAIQQLKKAQAGSGGSRGANQYKREKFKLHTLRLVLAGHHALEQGEVMVRLHDAHVEILREASQLPLDRFTAMVEDCIKIMDRAAEKSKLPDAPDVRKINALMDQVRGL